MSSLDSTLRDLETLGEQALTTVMGPENAKDLRSLLIDKAAINIRRACRGRQRRRGSNTDRRRSRRQTDRATRGHGWGQS